MSKTTVLLIEDDDGDAELVRAYLRSDGSFSVQVVQTLATACDRLHTGDPVDVVILDLNLSDSNGLETFTSLYRAFPDTPVVILSGQEDEELAVAAVGQGAQDYVPKSKADADTLARSLRYAIERNARRLAERRNLLWERDLATAREIQQHMLPSEPPRIDGFDIAGVCQPAEATGGDFFDFIPLAGGKWDLLVADVSSHGFAPALIMVGARRMLRTCAQLHEDIAECLTIVNRAIVEDTLDSQFVTMFFARLDPACRTLTHTAAGHAAYLLNAHGNSTTLESSGLPLGLSPDNAYDVGGTVTLQPGDIVLLMTDGAYEALAPDRELFGQQRIFDLIHQHRDQSAAEILDLVLEGIGSFCRPGAPKDDVTVVLVKVVGLGGCLQVC